jgi:hypothetical protein
MKDKKPTIRQARVINKTKKLLADFEINKDTDKKDITALKGEILKECGYSKSIQKSPDKVFNTPTISRELEKVIRLYEDKRDMALKAISKEKIEDSSGKDLAFIADKLQKHINNLTGIGGDNNTNNTKPLIIPIQIINKYANDSQE